MGCHTNIQEVYSGVYKNSFPVQLTFETELKGGRHQKGKQKKRTELQTHGIESAKAPKTGGTMLYP